VSNVKRALFWVAVDKYFGLAINFVLIAAISRLLSPQEIGIAAIGTAVFLIAESLRDFGVTTYVIQRRAAPIEVLRTTFTLLMITSGVLAIILFAGADWIAQLYEEPRLATYIHILASAFLIGPFAGPILAVLRRNMEFGKLALINICGVAINAVVVISMALAGYSYMSIAWGGLASAVSVAIMAVGVHPDFRIFRPALHAWGDAVRFGGIASITVLINRAYEALPLLILARLMPFDAVGLFQRATTVCQIPDRLVTTVVAPVALPTFAAKVRKGDDLKATYLQSISYITAVQWPTLIMLAVLAYPIVRLLLGPQWLEVAPLVQIMAIASMIMFPAMLTYPLLVAAGRVQDTMWSSLISLPLSLVALVPAAHLGLNAVALSLFITLPLQVYVALWFIKRLISFRWAEVVTATIRSGWATVGCVTGPMLVISAHHFAFDIPLASAILAGVLAVLGWLGGLWLTAHPLLAELRTVSAHAFATSSALLRRRC
jgi:O-antigen/teichoic acid export membrane protein